MQMHRVKEYKLVDRTVTFNHYHHFEIRPKDVRPTRVSIIFEEQFDTVFEGNMLKWDLQLKRNRLDSPWRLELVQMAICDKHPPPQKIQFTLNVMEKDGSVEQSLQYLIDGQTKEGRIAMESETIKTDPNSKFGKDLSKLMAIAEKKEQQVELKTQWVYDRDDFADLKYLLDEGAPIETENSESNFETHTKKSVFDFLHFFKCKTSSCQNLKLFTSDGTQFVMTNKVTVSRASEYFRGLLNEHTTELTVDSFDVEVININHEDLPYLCNLMIIAVDAKFQKVQLCCIATIVSYHACDFFRTMVYTRHPLSERLSTRGEQQHASLAEQVTDAFYQSLKAKPCINVISDD